MKVEIGESMMLSWLKHCKKCQVVQTNWKASTNTWTFYNREKVEMVVNELKEHYETVHEIDIFKKNKSVDQFIQQGEIDVLGLKINSGKVEEIYGVDVAFHEGGLNYGSAEETVTRVIKKMIRTALTINVYFDLNRANIIFASPKINNSVLTVLNGLVKELGGLFQKYDFEFGFELICNDGFNKEIYTPVIDASSIVADTSELFLRSLQMYNMFQQGSSTKTTSAKSLSKTENKDLTELGSIEEYDDTKIGKLVRESFPEIVEKGLLSEEDLTNLRQKNYCKEVFNINFPLLKEVSEGVPLDEQRKDSNGYSRYYSKTYRINGKQYLLCSQWYPWTKEYYVSWLKSMQEI